MTIADSIWTAAALLHRENSAATDFSTSEIIEKANEAGLVKGFKPGLQVFASKHCVANKSPNPCRYRILFETARGRRRLFKKGDVFHPNRQNGKVRPERDELPLEYQPLVDWYESVYSQSAATPASSVTPYSGMASGPVGLTSTRGESVFAELDALRAEPVFLGENGTITLPERLTRTLGIQEGSCLSIYREQDHLVLQPITEEFIRSLRGCLKPKPGETSLAELREREHRDDKY